MSWAQCGCGRCCAQCKGGRVLAVVLTFLPCVLYQMQQVFCVTFTTAGVLVCDEHWLNLPRDWEHEKNIEVEPQIMLQRNRERNTFVFRHSMSHVKQWRAIKGTIQGIMHVHGNCPEYPLFQCLKTWQDYTKSCYWHPLFKLYSGDLQKRKSLQTVKCMVSLISVCVCLCVCVHVCEWIHS